MVRVEIPIHKLHKAGEDAVVKERSNGEVLLRM